MIKRVKKAKEIVVPATSHDEYALANRAISIIKLLKNTKGDFAGKPFNLQPWQEEILLKLFRMSADGKRIVRESFIFLPRKNGKALAVDTPILTTKGWSTMGELNIGDCVIGSNGKGTKVIATSEVFSDHDCYRVETSDGRYVIADAGHLWTVYDRYKEREITIDTKTIFGNYIVGNRPTHRERRYKLPPPVVVSLPEKELHIDPYLLGAWLGDGTSARGEITTEDNEIEQAFAAGGFPASYRYQSGKAATLGLPGFVTKLKALGLIKNKHVPSDYLTASEAQRRALLAGLLDADGGVVGKNRQTRVEFTSTNKHLADAVLFLSRSLGWKSSLDADRATLYGKDCGAKYRVTWAAYREISPFLLPRKTKRLQGTPRKISQCRSRSVQITNVKTVESVPTKCIQVEARDGIYLAGEGLIPTHNSELIAAIAIFHLLFEGELGAEVILGASDKDQASIVYRAVEEMCRQEPNILKRVKLLPATKTITVPGTNKFLRAIPADEGGAHGLNPSLVVGDELHAWRGRGLYDALRTGQGARSAPLFIVITTAGFDKHSICYERYNYACQVRDGIIVDPSFLPVIYEAETADDWTKEAVWKKANPALRGATPFRSVDEMRRMCKEAQQIPAMQNAFRRLYLNQWTEQDVRWISTAAWDGCGGKPDDFEGRECFAALDLSATTDLTALLYLFPPTEPNGFYDIFVRFYVPENGARTRSARDKVPYEKWIKDGFITATSGDVIDYDRIKQDIQEDSERFHILQIAIDRWNATQLATQLTGAGFEVVPFGQGFASMAGPSSEFEKLVISKRYRHGGNPVLAWMAANVAVEQDAAGNKKPSKKKSKERIDGIVALVMATGLAIVAQATSPSVYETQGLLLLGDDD